MHQRGSRFTDFREILHLRLVQKCIKESQIRVKYGKNIGHFA
jgi:hypothetical protein